MSVFTTIAQYGVFVCACVLLFPWRAWRHSVSMVLGCLCDTWSPGHPGPGNTHCLLGPDMHNANISDGERGNTNSAVCKAAIVCITKAKIFMRRILWSTFICSGKSARNHLRAALYNSLKHFCTVLIWAVGLKTNISTYSRCNGSLFRSWSWTEPLKNLICPTVRLQ